MIARLLCWFGFHDRMTGWDFGRDLDTFVTMCARERCRLVLDMGQREAIGQRAELEADDVVSPLAIPGIWIGIGHCGRPLGFDVRTDSYVCGRCGGSVHASKIVKWQPAWERGVPKR